MCYDRTEQQLQHSMSMLKAMEASKHEALRFNPLNTGVFENGSANDVSQLRRASGRVFIGAISLAGHCHANIVNDYKQSRLRATGWLWHS